jgi:hypothetical protein
MDVKERFQKSILLIPGWLRISFSIRATGNNIHKILTIQLETLLKTVLFFQISPKNRQNAPFFCIVFPLRPPPLASPAPFPLASARSPCTKSIKTAQILLLNPPFAFSFSPYRLIT